MTASSSDQALRPLYPKREDDDLSTYFHRQVIGGLGFALPILLWLLAGLRHMAELQRWQPLGSVSAYYHTGGVAAFVGILFTLAIYLFTYQGYANEYHRRDRVAAFVAAFAAILVAFFPTGAPEGLSVPSWWTQQAAMIHNVSAIVLFGAFIFFCLFLFPKSKKGRPLTRDKHVRNIIYYSCGVGMVACVVLVGILHRMGSPIVWPEALALEFFAVSWLVKGRADWTAVSAGKRTLYYGLHPRQLAREAWRAIRS